MDIVKGKLTSEKENGHRKRQMSIEEENGHKKRIMAIGKGE